MKLNFGKFRILATFISGFILCNLDIYISGYLAALTVPRQYFLWFGRHHTAALVIVQAFTFALPIFIISMAWSIFFNFMFRTQHLVTAMCCFCGFALTWIILMLNFGSSFHDLFSFTDQPWIFLNTIAGPCGILFAGFILYKFHQGNDKAHLA